MTNYYADDTAIGDEHFDGETVPGDNTISTSRNTRIKNRCQRYINHTVLKTTSDVTDIDGQLEEAFLELYGGALNPRDRQRKDGTFGLTDARIYELRNAFNVKSIFVQDPTDGSYTDTGQTTL